ncbi:FKBP-type peptidyl-prolyl cis-trans isomerase [uncultured Micrococcus sp.]|uniref:FKBP-type peptidyl-prolyl cis-trans isomerase n=1 Tax=uncultured Micrococcus sp. TaxID=114051 RepID=UPI002599176C|nr:FKBP-type peptidyl-prolyl cis-trans isomerase [uncultured Micrococcus sp.]
MSFGQRDYDRTRPEIDFPGENPPTELVIEDLIPGTGAEVVPGSTVQVHYVGVSWSTGEEFDASWNRGAPLPLTVGVGQVIAGWDQGLLGMKEGGRRRLEIPPHLGYGARGAGSAIGPNETLIFVCDLVSVS